MSPTEFLTMISTRSPGRLGLFTPSEATGWLDCESEEPMICRRPWGDIVLDGRTVRASWVDGSPEGLLYRTEFPTEVSAYMAATAALRCHGSELEPLLGEPVGELP